MNHYARVCNKRRSPRSSPNKSSFNVKRPQSPRNNQFRYQNGSNINKLEPQFNQMTVIQNLQEQLNQLQMQQQQEINTHSLRTSPISAQPYNSKSDHPTSILHIQKGSKHAPNLSKDDANRNDRGLPTQ